MNKTSVGGLPHGSYIVTDNSAVIAQLNNRITELEEENRKLEECFDDCYVELGKVQHELNRALKVEAPLKPQEPTQAAYDELFND